MMNPVLSQTHPAISHDYAAYTNQGFLLREASLVAELLLQGQSQADIRHEVMTGNLFQLQAAKSRQTIFRAVMDRLEEAPEPLLTFLAEGSLELKRLTNLYLVLLKHRLLREFIAELLLEELLRFGVSVTPSDLKAYFERKRSQVPEVAAWSDTTLKNARSTIMGICTQANLLTKQPGGVFLIQPQVVPMALREELKQAGREAFLPLLLDRGGP